jgi:hypothetical protein
MRVPRRPFDSRGVHAKPYLVAIVSAGLLLLSPPVRAADSAPGQPPTTPSVDASGIPMAPAGSLVLISGRTIAVSRSRVTRVRLSCAGTTQCGGVLRIVTAKPIVPARVHMRGAKRVLRLGLTKFVTPAQVTARVKVRLSRNGYRLVKRLRQLKVSVVVQDLDSAGHTRTSKRVISLKAS